MNYLLARLRQELASRIEAILGVEGVVVEDANPKIEADLAVTLFAYAKLKQRPPAELAGQVAAELKHDYLQSVTAAGGYVNMTLKNSTLVKVLETTDDWSFYGNNERYAGQEIIIEHTDPNPFKELHIGHVYSNTVGESLARLHEAGGAKVHRVSYHGDTGLHVAKAVWSLGRDTDWSEAAVAELEAMNIDDEAILLEAIKITGRHYAKGHEAYESDETAKAEIKEINRKISTREDTIVNRLYDWGCERSFAYFNFVYKNLGAPLFERRFLESESGPKGAEIVKSNTGGVFKENDGAIIYEGEQDGLHTRVFINSQGLPTYEAKDLGLAILKDETFSDYAKSIILTGNEVDAYFQVVMAALNKIYPELVAKTTHLSHGMVRLPEGKMSSRSGRVKTALDFIEDVRSAVQSRAPDSPAIEANTLAAIKYSFLKPAVGGDIIYDLNESIALEGQTGPYIQYAAVRISSILQKLDTVDTELSPAENYDWEAERSLLKLIWRYPEVVEAATAELQPHRIAQFSYELAREFNRYYESTPVSGAEPAVLPARVATLRAVYAVIGHGLGLLNINVPEKM